MSNAILNPMRLLTSFLFGGLLAAQSTVSVQEPISVLPPLVLSGVQISCPGCGSGGGGGTGSGLFPWNPPPSQPPTLSNWTQVDGSGTGTYADVTGGVFLSSIQSGTCGGSNGCMRGIYQAAPSGPFTLTTHQNAMGVTNNQVPEYGIWIGDTGTKMVWYGCKGSPTVCHVTYWNSPTSWQSEPFAATPLMQVNDVWQRILYDGTSFYFQLSGTGADSISWLTLTSLAANTFLSTAPAKLGVHVYSQPNGPPTTTTLGYWKVTQP